LILLGVLPLGGVKHGWMWKTSYFLTLYVNILKAAGDASKVTINIE